MTQIPDEIKNVTVKLKANIYFEGGVISHTLLSTKGSKQTVGLIRPGTYHFTTDTPEQMDLIAGSCRVKFSDESQWKIYKAGETFNVPGKSAFDIAVDSGVAEYLCSYE